jgi:hypothetical protein
MTQVVVVVVVGVGIIIAGETKRYGHINIIIRVSQ